MTKKRLPVRFILLLAAMTACAFFFAPKPPAATSPAAGVQADAPADRLFPGLSPSGVTTVDITTPQASFRLRRNDEHAVSINGQQGDRDVFLTLLEHIAGIPFTVSQPFSTQDAPLLTMCVTTHEEEYTASFYSHGGEYAHVVAPRGGVLSYGITDGWRIGTLLLACEGTRIQDESGRETPANQISNKPAAR